MAIAGFLLVGLVAGWLGGLWLGNRVYGVAGDVIVGMLGAMLGGYVFGALGLQLGVGVWASVAVAALGALILIVLMRLVKSPPSFSRRSKSPESVPRRDADAKSR